MRSTITSGFMSVKYQTQDTVEGTGFLELDKDKKQYVFQESIPLSGGQWSGSVQRQPLQEEDATAPDARPGIAGGMSAEMPCGDAKQASFWQQLKAMVWRNTRLKIRNCDTLFQELFFPVYFIAILAMIKALSKPALEPGHVFPVNDFNSTSFGFPFLPGMQILASPDTPQNEQVMQQVVSQLYGSPSYVMFATEEAAQDYYYNLTDTDRHMVAAAVLLDYNAVSNSYAIRVRSGSIPSITEPRDTDPEQCKNENGTDIYSCPVNQYLGSGFAQLQLALDNVIMQNLGVKSLNLTTRRIQVQIMDKAEYQPDTYYIQTVSSLYFVLSFAFLVGFLATNIVAEKEKKIKDGMMMMGLRSSVFWFSWSIIYIILVIVASSLIIGILAGSKFFSNSNLAVVFIALVLYGMSFIAYAFMLTPFFNKAKTAGTVAGLTTILLSACYQGISQMRDANSYNANIDPSLQWLMCLFSPLAFSYFIDQAIFLDIKRNGFDFDSSMVYGQFPLYAPVVMLVVDTVLYSLLTVYFDKVVPGEYGVRYHPLFFLRKTFWCPNSNSGERRKLMTGALPYTTQTADIEPVGASHNKRIAMRINSLTKTYKVESVVKKVVNGFCLDIYEGHITCLLGHNGAGKTTLINMLTGVVPPTEGNATIMGLDVSIPRDMEKIRAMCGICPQHNILYDTLSCREHLKIFANIKGVPQSDIPKTIENTLKDVDLESQADTLARNLSGGQKRKLSVAIALIGNPKLIFLDEPTAGMDPYSRRHIWSLLKKRKEGRVIVLTTHFMDEADILSDRKAFISQGKLRCCGSSLFLKNKFGIGYHLTMVVDPDCDVHNVTTQLQAVIPSVELERHHGKEIAFTIPQTDVSQFSSLFGLLDEKSEVLGIKSYGVSLTTLEEVFLKLEDSGCHDDNLNKAGKTNGGFASNGDPVRCEIIGQKPPTFGAAVLKGKELTRQKIKALLRLRCILFFSNIKYIIMGLVLPTLLAIAALVILKIIKTPSPPSPHITALTFDPLMYTAEGNDSGKNPMLIFNAISEYARWPRGISLFAGWSRFEFCCVSLMVGLGNPSAQPFPKA